MAERTGRKRCADCLFAYSVGIISFALNLSLVSYASAVAVFFAQLVHVRVLN